MLMWAAKSERDQSSLIHMQIRFIRINNNIILFFMSQITLTLFVKSSKRQGLT